MPVTQPRSPRLFTVRRSAIHGRGVFAAAPIVKGARIIEYVGECISPAEADARYGGDYDPAAIVLLFIADKNTVIDAGVGGNSARFINHSCVPNCQSVQDAGRVFIEALRDIAPGEELTYDYRLELSEQETALRQEHYRCRCGSAKCRGFLFVLRRKRLAKKTPAAPKKPSVQKRV